MPPYVCKYRFIVIIVINCYLCRYWALGFHQCRYGYHELKDVEEVVDKYKENKVTLAWCWSITNSSCNFSYS